MKTKKKKRKKRKKKDLKGKKDFKKEMAKKEDYPETSIDPVSRQDLIAYSKNSSSSVELTHPVINLSDSIVDNNFQQDDIITVKVEKQLLTIENGKIKDDYEHDHRQNNTFENEEKRKKKMRKSIKHKQATNKSIVDKKMKLYKKNQYKYVKKLANSGLRLVAWGTQADVIEDNGTVLYEEARDIYLKSL